MNIAVLGTGVVGRTLAGRLFELGHTVTLGTRDPSATLTRLADTRPHGVELLTFADAAAGAELVVNATGGVVTLAVLAEAGEANLGAKILVDVSNPLDFSAGFPPRLSLPDTDSVSEQVQRAFPAARVVKTLNTMTADVMVHPDSVGRGDHTVFVSGNDADAKTTVTSLLHELGHRDVLDLGDITTARGAETFLVLWLRVMGALGTAQFQIKVVR
jgi:8-hydroxy-5-deazaflavin:NADPH oxidoreductase